MEHLHAAGSCTGILRVTSAGVSFTSLTSNDSFAVKYSEFEAALADDVFTIKAGPTTYRFKTAGVTGRDQSLSQLRKAMTAIAAYRK